MKNLTFLIFAFFLFAFQLIVQTKSIKKSQVLIETTPKSAGISTERFPFIDQMSEQEVANENIQGVVTVVAFNGKIVH